MIPALEGFLAAEAEHLGGPESLRAAADELSAVVAAIEAHGDLMAVVTDAGVDVANRRAILADLFASRVRPEVGELIGQTVAVANPAEVTGTLFALADGLRLIETEIEDGTTIDAEARTLGLEASRRRVAGYAASVLAHVATDDLLGIEDELFRFARTVEDNRALRNALGDREFPVSVRRGIVDDLLEGKVADATLRMVRYVVRAARPRDIAGTLFFLVETVARVRGWRVARVTASADLDAGARSELSAALGHLAAAPVELQVVLDPSLVGGVVVEIGDLRVDASTRHRLEQLREHVLADQGAFAAGKE